MFMILIQSNSGKKSSEGRAEDQSLDRYGAAWPLLPCGSVFLLDAIPYLSYTSLCLPRISSDPTDIATNNT